MSTMNPRRLSIGVDPGGRYTGLVVVDGYDVLTARVIDLRREVPDHELLGVDDRLARWAGINVAAVEDALVDLGDRGLPPGTPIGVESVRAPNPHRRRRDGNSLTNPEGVIVTAVVVGRLMALDNVVLVAPGGNGTLAPSYGYPPQIGPGVRLGGPSEHARSAYDVAIAARHLTNRAQEARHA